jgi:hypothetical protein
MKRRRLAPTPLQPVNWISSATRSKKVLQSSNPVMTDATSSRKNATWNFEEETALLDFLFAHKAEAGDGCMFKAPVWIAAATEMLKFPLDKGAPKTDKACKGKWKAVCRIMSHLPQCTY